MYRISLSFLVLLCFGFNDAFFRGFEMDSGGSVAVKEVSRQREGTPEI